MDDESGPGDIEVTIVRPRHPPQLVVPHWHADDDDTIVRLIEPARPPRASGPPTRDVPAIIDPVVPPATAWSIRIRGTEVVVPLDVPLDIGRRPVTSRVPEHPAPRRVVIPAQHRDVSARHARIEQLGRSIVITDLGSTNGVVVHWSSGAVRRLRPGDSCVVLPDTVIELGEGVEVEFLASPLADAPH